MKKRNITSASERDPVTTPAEINAMIAAGPTVLRHIDHEGRLGPDLAAIQAAKWALTLPAGCPYVVFVGPDKTELHRGVAGDPCDPWYQEMAAAFRRIGASTHREGQP